MAKEYSRTVRLGEQIHRELADLIRREVKDPRVGMVTISGVDVSADLSHAKVYYTVMGDEEARSASKIGLEKAAGFLRGKIGQAIKTRITPQLHFQYDDSPERGAHLEALIEHAVHQDAERHKDESGQD